MSEFSLFGAEMREKVNCSAGAREAALGRMELATTQSRRKSRGQGFPGSPTSARSAGSFRLFAPGTNLPIEYAVGPYGTGNARCDKGFQRGHHENKEKLIR